MMLYKSISTAAKMKQESIISLEKDNLITNNQQPIHSLPLSQENTKKHLSMVNTINKMLNKSKYYIKSYIKIITFE